MDEKQIKESIRRCREESGLTQKEIAQKIGISRNAYADLENGGTRIFNEHLEKIASETSRSVEELVFGFTPVEDASKKLEEDRLQFDSRMKATVEEYERRLSEKDMLIEVLQKLVAQLELDCKNKDAIIHMSQKND